MEAYVRLIIYGNLIPYGIGLVAMSAIVLPGDGADLTFKRLLIGLGVLGAIQIVGAITASIYFLRKQKRDMECR